MQKIKKRLKRMKSRNRIYCKWESLSSQELNGFMAKCHAIVLPFLLVPSEIPLAIIEALVWGKPIISTSPGGTGEFVKELGAAPIVGDINGLTHAMISLYEDNNLYNEKCRKVIDAYEKHPTWHEVARQWSSIAEQVLASN